MCASSSSLHKAFDPPYFAIVTSFIQVPLLTLANVSLFIVSALLRNRDGTNMVLP